MMKEWASAWRRSLQHEKLAIESVSARGSIMSIKPASANFALYAAACISISLRLYLHNALSLQNNAPSRFVRFASLGVLTCARFVARV